MQKDNYGRMAMWFSCMCQDKATVPKATVCGLPADEQLMHVHIYIRDSVNLCTGNTYTFRYGKATVMNAAKPHAGATSLSQVRLC